MNAEYAKQILNNPLWQEYFEKRIAELLVIGMKTDDEEASMKARLTYQELIRERKHLEKVIRDQADEVRRMRKKQAG